MSVHQASDPPIYVAKDQEISINLKHLFTFFYKRRMYVIVPLLFSLIVAGIYVYFLPTEYETTLQFSITHDQETPYNDRSVNLLGSINSLLGNSGTGNSQSKFVTIQGALYSAEYIEKLVHKPLYFSSLDTTLTLEDFFALETEVLSDSITIIDTRMSNTHEYRQKYSLKTLHAISELRSRVSLEFAELMDMPNFTNVNELKVRLPDATATFHLTEYILQSFVDYVYEWRTVDERRNVQFLKKRLTSVKRAYDSTKAILAVYKDTHMHAHSSQAKLKENALKLESQLQRQVYLELAIQYEQAKTRLHVKLPSINVVKPAYMPNGSRFGVKTIFLIATAIGLFIGIGIIIFQLVGYISGDQTYLKPFVRLFKRRHTTHE